MQPPCRPSVLADLRALHAAPAQQVADGSAAPRGSSPGLAPVSSGLRILSSDSVCVSHAIALASGSGRLFAADTQQLWVFSAEKRTWDTLGPLPQHKSALLRMAVVAPSPSRSANEC